MSRIINYLFLLSLSLNFMGCTSQTEMVAEIPSLIPKPQRMEVFDGQFSIDKSTTVFAEPEFKLAEDFLRNYIYRGVGFDLQKTEKAAADIVFELDPSQPAEGYALDVSEEKITIKASDAGGAFYAVQTLRQMLPEALEAGISEAWEVVEIRQVSITDAPRFRYRGMHLDVARHFFDKEFVKEYISHLSMLKMNYFHWHLTEDQGWRIEIKKYPRLTTHAAFRNETLIGHFNDTPHRFDGKQYGGFYTQDEVKEIVAFADALNVTIIPEIEMPGHAQAAISAYPELGCTGEQVPVATKWGVFENIYCPKQKTFAFLEDVLTEVIELFPGEYIHIGGDEAPKEQWKACDHCQKLIRELDLKDENGLQSYFIKEIEAFVNSKGKKIIGWDEILEGGLAPNATVMSWRGTQGAVEAAKEGHDVILTPGSHAYFDHYQAEHEDEPLAIGGFLPLKKVFGFNPIPEELTTEEAKFVLGAQGNVWTEYMKTTDHVEYMIFPRILAMSEVVWNGPNDKPEENYPDFLHRVEKYMNRLDVLDVNYANHLYDVEGKVVKRNDSVFYELTTAMPDKTILYSTPSSTPEPQRATAEAQEKKEYKAPIPITESARIEASVSGRVHIGEVNFHKGIRGTVSLNIEPHPAYAAGGKEALINGVSGSDKRYGDKEWLGFWGEDLEIRIDFPEPINITKISTRFHNANGQWIYAPLNVGITVTMKNGNELNKIVGTTANPDVTMVPFEMEFSPNLEVITNSVVLNIPNYGTIPAGSQGAGNKAWTFIDEIVIE